MQTITKIRKYFIISFFLFLPFGGNAVNHVNFLPMEDGLASVRNEAYGASINNIKPFRQIMPVEPEKELSESGFGSTDFLLFALLAGVYIIFSRRKSASRNAGL